MAAPHIPNLLSLRGNRGEGWGRGRGRGRGVDLSGPEASDDFTRAQNDKIVQATDTDANVSRMSAVTAGYLSDPFAKEFAAPGEVQRRYPIINRGKVSQLIM
jgi:[phosphatase 2A protein]-leucine-carboxy methyltransferase